jgi:hypothetical protein
VSQLCYTLAIRLSGVTLSRNCTELRKPTRKLGLTWIGNVDIQNKIYGKESNELLWAKTAINNQIIEEVNHLHIRKYNASFMKEIFSYLFKPKDKLTVSV